MVEWLLPSSTIFLSLLTSSPSELNVKILALSTLLYCSFCAFTFSQLALSSEFQALSWAINSSFSSCSFANCSVFSYNSVTLLRKLSSASLRLASMELSFDLSILFRGETICPEEYWLYFFSSTFSLTFTRSCWVEVVVLATFRCFWLFQCCEILELNLGDPTCFSLQPFNDFIWLNYTIQQKITSNYITAIHQSRLGSMFRRPKRQIRVFGDYLEARRIHLWKEAHQSLNIFQDEFMTNQSFPPFFDGFHINLFGVFWTIFLHDEVNEWLAMGWENCKQENSSSTDEIVDQTQFFIAQSGFFQESNDNFGQVFILAFFHRFTEKMANDGAKVKQRMAHAHGSKVNDSNNFLAFFINHHVIVVKITMDGNFWSLCQDRHNSLNESFSVFIQAFLLLVFDDHIK